MAEPQSIFGRYHTQEPFVDRYVANSDGAVDIVIPVLHSNELWRSNLISIYREVPVHRLRLGDAGCKDETLIIARQFPRVEIYDHSSFKSLGYSVKELIKAVETEWFCYFHSDVYLPDGWFDTMRAHQAEYDWFGCPMRITALVEYPLVDRERPYAGTQMGRKAAFAGGLDRIGDDYVYRQEDWVFAGIVEDGGFRHGKIEDTFHWHQVMPRVYGDTRRTRKFKEVRLDVEMTHEEELYTAETQLRGTIKYLKPTAYHVNGANIHLRYLKNLGKIDAEFYDWVGRTNPVWRFFLPAPPVTQSEAPPPEQPIAAPESAAKPPADHEVPAPERASVPETTAPPVTQSEAPPPEQPMAAPESAAQPPADHEVPAPERASVPEMTEGAVVRGRTSLVKTIARSILRPVLDAARRAVPGSKPDLAELAIAQRNEALERNRRLEALLNLAIEQRNQASQERDAVRAELSDALARGAEERRLVRNAFNELRSGRKE